jgi:Fe-S cluster assembly scaffold protein SufB
MMVRSAILFGAGVVAALSAGWYVYPLALYQSEPQPLQFSHRIHAEKAGMKCEDCHTIRADGVFTGIPQVEKCAGCHATPAGNTAEEKLLVERYVTPNREIPWKVYARQPDNAWFPHAYHVNLAKIACEKCHGEQGKSDKLRDYASNRLSGYSRDFRRVSFRGIAAATAENMSDCERCHAEKGVTAGCIDCHK